MAFSSALFIFFVFPVFFALYYRLPAKYWNPLLVAASFLFYTMGGGAGVLLLLASTVINQFIAVRLAKTEGTGRKRLLGLGIALNLGALIYYKYFEFLWGMVVDVLSFAGIASPSGIPQTVLPLGISFFTFQAISYLVDVHRRAIAPATSYAEFGLYHSLFPQLVAGPIVRFREIEPAIGGGSVTLEDISTGAYRFCLGFGKKIILADNLGRVADQIIALPLSEIGAEHAWLAIGCYTLQIYFDFSGYSDMAIGLGRMLGFRFPENFLQPYRSASITEFWRRWHITLSRWFRDYVYIPLGGNRRGPFRTSVNLTVVFCLCGLWHGAGLNFLVWGLYHGVLLAIERVLERRWGWIPSAPVGIPLTVLLVSIGWVFFRIEDIDRSLSFLARMFWLTSPDVVYLPLRHFLSADTVAYMVAAIGFALLPLEHLRCLRFDRVRLMLGQTGFALVTFVYAAMMLMANSFNPFIYFRF